VVASRLGGPSQVRAFFGTVILPATSAIRARTILISSSFAQSPRSGVGIPACSQVFSVQRRDSEPRRQRLHRFRPDKKSLLNRFTAVLSGDVCALIVSMPIMK
jgi:hypothetical protein